MLGPEAIDILCNKAKFLAVNTQVNADNHGFNTISKYLCADYISISEAEIRLETRNRKKDIKEIVLDVAKNLSCSHIMLTQGENGCLCYNKKEGFLTT